MQKLANISGFEALQNKQNASFGSASSDLSVFNESVHYCTQLAEIYETRLYAVIGSGPTRRYLRYDVSGCYDGMGFSTGCDLVWCKPGMQKWTEYGYDSVTGEYSYLLDDANSNAICYAAYSDGIEKNKVLQKQVDDLYNNPAISDDEADIASQALMEKFDTENWFEPNIDAVRWVH